MIIMENNSRVKTLTMDDLLSNSGVLFEVVSDDDHVDDASVIVDNDISVNDDLEDDNDNDNNDYVNVDDISNDGLNVYAGISKQFAELNDSLVDARARVEDSIRRQAEVEGLLADANDLINCQAERIKVLERGILSVTRADETMQTITSQLKSMIDALKVQSDISRNEYQWQLEHASSVQDERLAQFDKLQYEKECLEQELDYKNAAVIEAGEKLEAAGHRIGDLESVIVAYKSVNDARERFCMSVSSLFDQVRVSVNDTHDGIGLFGGKKQVGELCEHIDSLVTKFYNELNLFKDACVNNVPDIIISDDVADNNVSDSIGDTLGE